MRIPVGWHGSASRWIAMFHYLVPVEKVFVLSFPRRRESRQVIVISWIPAFTGMLILDEILQIRYIFNQADTLFPQGFPKTTMKQ